MSMSIQTSDAVVLDLNTALAAAPAESIVSRTFYGDDQLKAVLFSFAAGQELSEHTAATPAILHILQGEADLTLGGAPRTAGPGTWVHLPARLPHALVAR